MTWFLIKSMLPILIVTFAGSGLLWVGNVLRGAGHAEAEIEYLAEATQAAHEEARKAGELTEELQVAARKAQEDLSAVRSRNAELRARILAQPPAGEGIECPVDCSLRWD